MFGTIAWGLVFGFLFPGIVSEMPRKDVGEDVFLLWWVCVSGYILGTAGPPALIALLRAPTRRLKLALFCGAVMNAWLILYPLDFMSLLSKAWRRGL